MIRELGLGLKIDELYLLRKEAEKHLAEESNKKIIEVSSVELIPEVYNRLVCTDNIRHNEFSKFKAYFLDLDFKAEVLIKNPNAKLVQALKKIKEKGYTIHCVSQISVSSKLLQKCIAYYELDNIFEAVHVPADFKHSEQSWNIYANILDKLALGWEQVAILNANSNIKNSNFNESEIQVIDIYNELNIITKEKILKNSDQRSYRRVVRNLYKKCNNKSAPPHSDYILFYYVYIERLYKKAKKDNIKTIFFLAREGLFLKKLFDYYQNEVSINEKDNITAYYFKASRNSLMLASFKDLKVEEFEYLKRRWPTLSINSFLKNFNFTQEIILSIVKNAGLEEKKDEVLENFLDSKTFETLMKNERFIEAYDKTRNDQKRFFKNYLSSFNVDIESDGFHLADVGWGGTMQNRLYDFFNEKIEVHGYYLGVREINNIRKRTIKNGLNFSVYPYPDFFDHILMANVELNEQLLAAGHGSTVAYTNKDDSYTIEHHEEIDKKIFEKFIRETQDFMFSRFKELTHSLKTICYDYDLEQYEMTDHALRIGLFASKRKVRREVEIYKGFYQNVGNFSVGLAMGENFDSAQKIRLVKDFFLKPEHVFRYVLRLKPMLLRKKKYLLAHLIPTRFMYYHIKLRCHTKQLTPKRNSIE
ncbi:hypothetical protein [Maribacter sp. 2210JD10-5]|uniref:hypothetical protein n=1 Tax=Maribacter sp. 2210JD10-5 TaxID=3386272 RepID=UPI0039BD3F88